MFAISPSLLKLLYLRFEGRKADVSDLKKQNCMIFHHVINCPISFVFNCCSNALAPFNSFYMEKCVVSLPIDLTGDNKLTIEMRLVVDGVIGYSFLFP